MSVADEKTCPACGKAFGCGARTGGCWCAEVSLTEEARVTLRERFEDCLCPGCLESWSKQPEAQTEITS